jgi:16S rRNA processing protein RimM
VRPTAKTAIVRTGQGGGSRKGNDLQVTVGRIGRPHGIRGDVVVGVKTDEPELRFAKGARLDTDPASPGPLTVAGTRYHSGELLVRFAGVSDRDAAAELRGTWLLVDSATLPAPEDPDEFLDTDLIGLSVRTVDGTPVGTVEDVLHPGQDVLVVKSAAKQEILVPFIKQIVPEVDVKAGFLVIDPPDGLLDLADVS